MTRNSISQTGTLFAPPYLHPSVKGQVTSGKHATWTTPAADPKAAADQTDGARCHTQPTCSPSRFEMTRNGHLVAPGRACPANGHCPDSGFTRDSSHIPTGIVTFCTAPNAPGHRRVAEDCCNAGAHKTDGFRSVLHREVASIAPKQVPTAFNRSYEHAMLSATSTKRHRRRADRSACSPRPREARHRCRASQRPGADPCAW